MASADPDDDDVRAAADGDGDGDDVADHDIRAAAAGDGDDDGGDADADDDADGGEAAEGDDETLDEADADGESRPCLQQRFSPIAAVRTTLHPQGLVIQVHRLFRQRTIAVSYERLVLDPTTIVSLRKGLLWTATGLCAAAMLARFPALPAGARELSTVLAPALLVAGILVLLAAISHPRRVTLFLDREAGMHPSFLRGGPQDAEVAEFVRQVQRAIVEFRCRPPDAGDGAPPAAPRLAATLDALLAMEDEELLTGPEFAHFRELALRR